MYESLFLMSLRPSLLYKLSESRIIIIIIIIVIVIVILIVITATH